MKNPVEMIEVFIKAAAAALPRPYGIGDGDKAQNREKKQEYAQPNPPADQTRPDTVAAQKALTPPPVM